METSPAELPEVRRAWEETLQGHLDGVELAPEARWKYLQELASEFDLEAFFASQPCIPVRRAGALSLLSIGEVMALPVLGLCSHDGADGDYIRTTDMARLWLPFRDALGDRKVTGGSIDAERASITTIRAESSSVTGRPWRSEWEQAILWPFGPVDVLGAAVKGGVFPLVVVNTANPVGAWLDRSVAAAANGLVDPGWRALKEIRELVYRAIAYDAWNPLATGLLQWNALPDLAADLVAPAMSLGPPNRIHVGGHPLASIGDGDEDEDED